MWLVTWRNNHKRDQKMDWKMAWIRWCERNLQQGTVAIPWQETQKAPTEVRCRTSLGGGKGGDFFLIQKTVTVTHQPEPQKIKCGPPAWLASDTRTQWHCSPGFFPPGWLLSQAGAVGHWAHSAQSCDQPRQNLCGLLQHKLCEIMTIISGIQLKLTLEH